MEYLQYLTQDIIDSFDLLTGFKPYYKWNTFNTSELNNSWQIGKGSFKPYYKWNTFNTTSVRPYF